MTLDSKSEKLAQTAAGSQLVQQSRVIQHQGRIVKLGHASTFKEHQKNAFGNAKSPSQNNNQGGSQKSRLLGEPHGSDSLSSGQQQQQPQ